MKILEIDTFPGIPSFLEVESPTVHELQEIVELLGYTVNDAKNWMGKDVIEYYRGKK